MSVLTPQDYYSTEEEFYNNLKDLAGKRLLFYCATGSSGRKDVVPGWSDIDVILIFDQLNEAVFTLLNKAIKKNTTGIKIGTTFYSAEEWKVYKFQDPKTFYAISYIKIGLYKPKICDSKIKLQELSPELLDILNQMNLSKELHAFKRALLEPLDEKIIYKLMSSILRIILLGEGIISAGYHDVWTKMKNKYPDFPLSLITPEEIMNNPNNFHLRLKEYKDFLIWFDKNVHDLL